MSFALASSLICTNVPTFADEQSGETFEDIIQVEEIPKNKNFKSSI